jgi:hypothetical protein
MALAVVVATPAQAARIPTAEESAALTTLIQQLNAECPGHRSVALPLLSDDGTWGRITAGCGDVSQGGAAFRGRGVWAHRSSATATDWAIVGPTEASRVPRCTGDDGLYRLVPEAVVRDLRDECIGPNGYQPVPILDLVVYRNAKHEFDTIGPSVRLTSLSGRYGSVGISRDGPPLGPGSKLTLKDLRKEFGAPRRTHCRARWAKLSLTATACASGTVTKLTLGAPWRLSRDTELGDPRDVGNAHVLVGDTIELAHYLDPQLAKLGPNQRLRLSKLRIGKADVTTTVVTRNARITTFEVAIKQRR